MIGFTENEYQFNILVDKIINLINYFKLIKLINLIYNNYIMTQIIAYDQPQKLLPSWFQIFCDYTHTKSSMKIPAPLLDV